MDKELINSHTKIKICGMTCEADIKAVNTYLPDYIGFVLFFPKSNRNISIEQAEHLLEKVDKKIRTVAVVVSPTTEQIRQIEKAGFDYIQIHGTVTEDVYKQCKLPILRAFNVSDLDKLNEYEAKDKKMIFLAGGIDETNVKRAISQVAPDVIDLSSAVEKTSEDGTFHGKDPEKIRTIVTMVHD